VGGVIIGAIIGAAASVVTTWINRKYSLEERKRDIELRREEQELAFVRAITPRCLDALQAAYKNSIDILALLYGASKEISRLPHRVKSHSTTNRFTKG
jgi:hypothetical protein